MPLTARDSPERQPQKRTESTKGTRDNTRMKMEPPRQRIDLLGKSEEPSSILPPKPELDPPEPPVVADPNCDERRTIWASIARSIPMNKSAFMTMISLILNDNEASPFEPPFQFAFNEKAASHNWRIIAKFGSLEKTIQAHPNTPISYGSEFRSPRLLGPILHRHHYWPRLSRMLTQGSTFPMKDQEEDLQLKDFEAALAYGNHQSAEKNKKVLLEHLGKELNKGWIIPLLPSDAKKIRNALISPLGVVSQSTINEHGEIVPSNRVTHDLSFPGKYSKSSVNSRTDPELLEPCRYGHMLLRIVHQIVALRLKRPQSPIIMQKIDFKSAYRRQHLNAKTAIQCMSSVEIGGLVFVLLNLRLSFGGSACPSEWCVISETLTDLANKILNHKSWDPSSIFPSMIGKVPKTEIMGEEVPYAKARPLLVEVPLEKVGSSDVYIDDICTVGILEDGDRDTELRLKSSVLLAMDVMGRPQSESEPLPRDPLPSIDKLLSEAGLSESKCLLGWMLDTRQLRISLHEEKYAQWTKQIQDLVEAERSQTTKKALEVTLGRLNHAASILPTSRHFLSRISFATTKANYFKPVKLRYHIIEDLKLWLKILDKLRSGVSMNLLTFRPPDITIWTDACEYGIGGYSYPRGRAWKWAIPEELKHRAHINILEFMAALVGIWVEIVEGLAPPESCILAFGDNTSAIGWLHKSKYRLDGENDHSVTAKLTVARKLASVIIDHEIRLFSTRRFQGISPSKRDRIIHLQRAVENAEESATTSRHRKFGSSVWRKWSSFLSSIGIEDDEFLESLESTSDRTRVVSLFAQSLREGESKGSKGLVAGSIRNSLSVLAQTFLENGFRDPRLTSDDRMPITLRRQLDSFKAEDPNEQRQKAVPISVLVKVHELYHNSEDPCSRACAQLIVGAFFFAMRSCEYCRTTSPNESTTTKLLCLRNIRFFKEGKLLSHSDKELWNADIVSITYESQKNKSRFQTISMHRSSSDKVCPVRSWAEIVHRIRSHPKSSDSTTVNAYTGRGGKLLFVSSNQIRSIIRAAAATIGTDKLGFQICEIGCHSLRSGSAMAMYLAKIPVTTIQLIGRWKSDAFMRYIREQVDCFTKNISFKMTQTKSFFTIPEPGRENDKTPGRSLSTTTKNGQSTDPCLQEVFEALVL